MITMRGSRAACWLVLMTACSGAVGPEVEVAEANAVESDSEALVVNALTAGQTKTALRLIDTICGDTWCAGDYDFRFRRLTCNQAAKTCTLTLQVFPIEGVVSSKRSYWRSCKTRGFTGFPSLVNTAPSGYQSLNGDYYDALTECTMRIEGNLH